MTKTKQLVFTALCIALGVVLPLTLHAVPNAGSVLLPMHIPVLLCGLICGWPYGLACGILTPALSSLLTGMPPAPYLPSMLLELAAYGLSAALLLRFVRTGNDFRDLCISLVGALIAGRLVMGVLNALIFRAGSYTFQAWIAASFVTALPGIIIQLIILPVIIQILKKAGVIQRVAA
jgi:niacin transporter